MFKVVLIALVLSVILDMVSLIVTKYASKFLEKRRMDCTKSIILCLEFVILCIGIIVGAVLG